MRVLTLKFIDNAGAALSGACALHCALLPVIVLAGPLLWLEQYEGWVLGITFVLSVIAMGWGWYRHKTWGPLLCAFLAWAWVGTMMMAHLPHEWLAISGVLLLVSHLWNKHRTQKKCGCFTNKSQKY